MSEFTLKRGQGKVFGGQNWKLAGDKQWRLQPMYVPNFNEKLVGTREIDGVEFVVFQCYDDEFLAQPRTICELPKPINLFEVISKFAQIEKIDD